MNRENRELSFSKHLFKQINANRWRYPEILSYSLVVIGYLFYLPRYSEEDLSTEVAIRDMKMPTEVDLAGEARQERLERQAIPVNSFRLVVIGPLLQLASDFYQSYKSFPTAKEEHRKAWERYRTLRDCKESSEQLLKRVRQLFGQPAISETKAPQYTGLAGKIDKLYTRLAGHINDEIIIDNDWLCAITQSLVREPVKAPDDFIFERQALIQWYDMGSQQCVINRNIELIDPRPLPIEINLQRRIYKFLQEQEYKTLHKLVTNNDHKTLKTLLENNSNPNLTNKKSGLSLLHYAAQYAHPDVVQVLLESKADVNRTVLSEISSLSIILSFSLNMMVSFSLLNPLGILARLIREICGRTLVASPVEMRFSGWTPLMFAADGPGDSRKKCVSLLLNAKANSDIKSLSGETAYSLAQEHQNEALQSLLRPA
ncbi:MAG: ankyrin repeat domain-containing protein [Proteobacteria bacterium]|nr:ankyrin repeat domain-containing protein [Pseudomonadota bacterium]